MITPTAVSSYLWSVAYKSFVCECAGQVMMFVWCLCAYIFVKLPQLLAQAAPVGLGSLFVPLTPEGPGLGQGPALLCLPPGLLRFLCSTGAQCRPLLILIQLLLQLMGVRAR